MLSEVIGENTSVAIGLIVTGIGTIVGAIWWAATMQAKVDMLLKFASATRDDVKTLKIEIDSIEKRVTRIEDHEKT